MKRTLLFILAFLPMLASADPVEIGGICYNLVEGTKEAEVTANLYRGDITIPESIEYEGITYSVTAIGEYAFYYCTGLKSVTIPNSVATIGESAFDGCKNLSSVTIANGVTSIGVAAFQMCSSLTSLTIPNSVTAIAEGAFQGCSGLQSIVVDKGNTVYDSREDCNALIKTSDNKLITGCMNTTIPNSITAIGSWAFFLCDGLTSINIPNSVTGIEQSAFWGCKNLVSINIPNSVTEIEEQTFALCEALTSVTIPNSVTTIGDQAFSGCIGLTSVTIGSKVKTIGSLAFTDCLNLLDVYCYAEEVPETQNEVFRYANIENVTLHVPAASISAYQAVEPWKNFKEIVALTDQGSNTDDSDYLPFVDRGKRWIVTRATPGRDGIDEVEYSIPLDVEEVDGKDYYRMKTVNTNNTETETYLIREESQKVYYYDPDLKMEFLAFDYSLKEGDTYETYSYVTHEMVTYTVWSVEDYTGGPQVKEYYYDENTGNMAVRYRYLRKWVASSYIESEYCYEPKVWIEGVGSLERPLTNLYQGSFTLDCLAYVLYNGQYDLYLPFSFNATDNKVLWYGRNMPISAKDDNSEDEQHQLTYEMEGDRLHVYGEVFCNCGPNHYAYFIEEPTDDHSVRKLHFKIQDVEPLVWCEALHTTDFYVEGLPPAFDYIIVDNQGVEHPVINKAPQMAYRPMIEDGKVWAVKVFDDGMPTRQWIEYYYLDGDTIVNGQTAKRMLVASEQDTSGKYVGAWYEQDKKVYYADKGKQQFELLYDFTLSTGDTTYEDEYMMYVVNKMSGGIPGFKGTYYVFLHNGDVMNRWLEGVGSESYPYINTMSGLVGRTGVLLVCKVGDEIIYYNSEEEDPYSMGAKKHRFDFTHTIKTKPQTRGEEEEQSLYGEYNNLLLGINLEPLDEAYLVRITNESDQVVYEKTINAGSIVGLNIDISAFAKGRYTVTIENSGESFTGEFETITTGIQELKSSRIEELKSIYNLQGQQLKTAPQKGIYIRNGKKVVIK